MIGPDGTLGRNGLEVGTEISLSMRPFGVGPRQYWTSLITEVDRRDGAAYFRDEMVRGPFDRWVHTHSFSPTAIGPSFEITSPTTSRSDLSGAVSPVSHVGFEAMFRERHRATNAELER